MPRPGQAAALSASQSAKRLAGSLRKNRQLKTTSKERDTSQGSSPAVQNSALDYFQKIRNHMGAQNNML